MAPAPEEGARVATIAYAKIYPGIGVARVGNSPDQYFLGPEVPGRPADAHERFKDRQGRMKRQACRFRVYGFDADGNVLQELTAAEADITWTVHLANAKAAWHQFRGAAAEAGGRPLPLRNGHLVNPTARKQLVIDPGPRSVRGPGVGGRGSRFDSGTFLGRSVDLGELRTDEAGRLLVLGGFGLSDSVDGHPVTHFANNDGWFDDTSDGPVTAEVVLKTGEAVPVSATSWVIVAPPDYAPPVENLVSLYDVQTMVAQAEGWLPLTTKVSFTEHVFPVLARAVGYRWVHPGARRGHGTGAAGDFLSRRSLARLASADAGNRTARQRVFARFRNPNLVGDEARRQANLTYMPQLSGDEGFTTNGEPGTWFSVLPHQYEALRRWAEGDFEEDWTGPVAVPQSFAALELAAQPGSLDRAAMEACVGGPFFPGIEMTYTCRDPSFYVEPYRLRPDLAAGDITKRMALPWQADFYECRTRWWPAQRPDEVITEAEYESVIAALDAAEDPDVPRRAPRDLRLSTEAWDRGLAQDPNAGPGAGDDDMVRAWWRLGVLRPRQLPNDETVVVEGERQPYFGMKDREYFHIMLNIEAYPDFLPMARELAERFLTAAQDLQRAGTCPDNLRPFTYTTRVLRSRLEQIYTEAAQSADAFSLSESSLTRDVLIERLRQMAPFNQLDGAWLRNVGKLGPIDEVRALLFHVWMDELGDGDPKLNHSNLYTDLLHSVGIYLEPVASRAYIENEAIVDSAFTSPLLQLVISQFSEDYLPEILGMTLYLEWAVVSVKPQVAVMESLGVDPLFYSLHIGIDNAATGHGAMARRAVELFLDEVRASSGDQAMQEAWSRVWDGYVAFATTGGLGQDFRRRVQNRPTPADRVYEIIQRKAHFGSQNHGERRIGANFINDWFADPLGFMRQLVTSGYVIPGDVEASSFFELLRPTGPMFRVFTDEEIRAWEDWTRSLIDPATPSEPDTDIAQLMVRMVETLRSRQDGTAGHRGNQLTGPAPDGAPDAVTQPVAWWFEQSASALLAALADPVNGLVTPGEPTESRFITDLANGNHPMALVLGEVAPGTAHRTWRTIAMDWIAAGCPLPAQASPVPSDVPLTVATAAASDLIEVAAESKIPLLGLFQNEAWQADYDDVPIYGNGALH